MTYFFGFESDEERRLAYIPMLVRMKLDIVGVKLSLAQWNQLPEPDRRRLFELPCDDQDQTSRYRAVLGELVLRHTGEAVRLLPPGGEAAWNDLSEVPAQVTVRARDHGVAPPSVEQWRALTTAQRYALLKLTRAGHESASYVSALREFALI